MFDGNFSFIDSLFDHAHNAGGGTSLIVSDTDAICRGALRRGRQDARHRGRPAGGRARLPRGRQGCWLSGAPQSAAATECRHLDVFGPRASTVPPILPTTATNFGFFYHSGGGEFGVDYRKDSWLFGAAIAYDKTSVDQNTTGDSGHIGSVRFGAYTSYQPGAMVLHRGIGRRSSTLFSRTGSAPSCCRRVRATTRKVLAPGSKRGANMPCGAAFIQPLAGLVYTDLHTNAFVENGGSPDRPSPATAPPSICSEALCGRPGLEQF